MNHPRAIPEAITRIPRHLAVDVGARHDFTTCVGAERYIRAGVSYDHEKQTELHIRHAERLPRGTPFPKICEHVIMLARAFVDVDVIVDATGLGHGLSVMLRERGLEHHAITITSGSEATYKRVKLGYDWKIGKRVIVEAVALALDTRRLKIANALPFSQTLISELASFDVHVTPSGHEVFGAKSGKHDDLVIATGLALWSATRKRAQSYTFTHNLFTR